MLIQISNQCDEGCPHCLQDSREDGGLMPFDTFKDAVRFGYNTGWHLFLITGGEPTMHPDMEKLIRWFDDMSQKIKREFGTPIMFAIATNGTWIEDAEKRRMMWRIARLKSYMFTQVYTNKRWYADYDFIQDWRTELQQIPALYGGRRRNPDARSRTGEDERRMSGRGREESLPLLMSQCRSGCSPGAQPEGLRHTAGE